MQDLALGLVDPHEVHTGPLLQLVQVSLDGIPSLRYVDRTTRLGVICKLAEGILNPTVIDEDLAFVLVQFLVTDDCPMLQSI